MRVPDTHSMSTSPVSVFENVAPASALTYTALSSVIEYVASAPVVFYAVIEHSALQRSGHEYEHTWKRRKKDPMMRCTFFLVRLVFFSSKLPDTRIISNFQNYLLPTPNTIFFLVIFRLCDCKFKLFQELFLVIIFVTHSNAQLWCAHVHWGSTCAKGVRSVGSGCQHASSSPRIQFWLIWQPSPQRIDDWTVCVSGTGHLFSCYSWCLLRFFFSVDVERVETVVGRTCERVCWPGVLRPLCLGLRTCMLTTSFLCHFIGFDFVTEITSKPTNSQTETSSFVSVVEKLLFQSISTATRFHDVFFFFFPWARRCRAVSGTTLFWGDFRAYDNWMTTLAHPTMKFHVFASPV